MSQILAVALGGALGALARFGVGWFVGERFPSRFPLATLLINVSGSFIIGLFLTLVSERVQVSPVWRLAIAVGFVGAFTTFSTFEYETFKLLETGDGIGGLMNVVLSVTLGFLAVWGGITAARQMPVPNLAALDRGEIVARLTGALRSRPNVESPPEDEAPAQTKSTSSDSVK